MNEDEFNKHMDGIKTQMNDSDHPHLLAMGRLLDTDIDKTVIRWIAAELQRRTPMSIISQALSTWMGISLASCIDGGLRLASGDVIDNSRQQISQLGLYELSAAVIRSTMLRTIVDKNPRAVEPNKEATQAIVRLTLKLKADMEALRAKH